MIKKEKDHVKEMKDLEISHMNEILKTLALEVLKRSAAYSMLNLSLQSASQDLEGFLIESSKILPSTLPCSLKSVNCVYLNYSSKVPENLFHALSIPIHGGGG